jgi:dephospho-CoA kinase
MLHVIGITGGIATGKSLATTVLKEMGYIVIDSDHIAQQLLSIGGLCYQEVVNAFGKDIVNDDGSINRPKLGEIIFNDSLQRQKLNNIVHPAVRRRVLDILNNLNSETSTQIVFLDVPLLYEAHFEDLVDKVVVIYTSYQNQIKRLVKRDHIAPLYAKTKIATQMPLDEKCRRADFIIDNNGPKKKFKEKLKQIIININEEV